MSPEKSEEAPEEVLKELLDRALKEMSPEAPEEASLEVLDQLWSTISFGDRDLPDDIVERARRAGGLEETHDIRKMGSGVTCLVFEPPLGIKAAVDVAATLANELGAQKLQFIITPRQSGMEPPHWDATLLPLPQQR